MATADELLAAALEAGEDKTLVIDNDLRTITIPPSVKYLGVESDDDVLRLHFRMPSMYGDIDLSKFKICINYLNAQGTGDVYTVEDAETSGGFITFSWLVGRTAAASKGTVRFVVCLKKADDAGAITEEFNTTVAALPVLEGLETTEKVVQQNPDVLEDILRRLKWLEVFGGGGTGGPAARIANVELPAANWQGDASPYSQVVNIEGVTEYSQVDLTPSVEQLAIFYDKDLSFVTENEDGVVTVYAIGQKPENDYTMQATIKEVAI